MDSRPDPGFTITGHSDDLVVRAIRLAVSYKGFDTKHVEANDLTLKNQNLILYGFWPIVGFLDDRYPHPPLFPEDATERAIVRSITNELLRTPDPVFSLLRQHSDGTHFALGKRLSMADITVLAFLEYREDVLRQKLPLTQRELRAFLTREIAVPWMQKKQSA